MLNLDIIESDLKKLSSQTIQSKPACSTVKATSR